MKHLKQLLVAMLIIVMTITPLTIQAKVTDPVGTPKMVTVVPIDTQAELDEYHNTIDNIVAMDARKSDEVMRIEVAYTGALYVYASVIEGATEAPMINLYKDEQATQLVNDFDGQTEETEATKDFAVSAGTYYLKLSRKEAIKAAKYGIAVGNVNGGAKTLAQNKPILSFSQEGSENTYFKISASGTGSLAIETKFASKNELAYITLCDNNKKAISIQLSLYSGESAHYAVKKGIYYVCVSTDAGLYQISRKMAAVSNKAGATQVKAKALSKGGNSVKAKGVMTINDTTKKEDWYKVTLTKKQKVSFQITGDCSGTISMEIIPARGKLYGTSKVSISPSKKSNKLQSSGAWSAGTYYIKVTKAANTTSGYYQLYIK